MYSTIIAYTDGSACVKGERKGHGGFGTFIPDLFGERKAYSLGFQQTKTGRMEIMALIYALKAVSKCIVNVELTVYSDSEYVVKTFTEKRLEKWIANDWMSVDWKGNPQPIKNRDLWEKVIQEISNRELFFLELRHIRSHQVEKEKDPAKKILLLQDPHIKGNRIADALANYKRHTKLLKSDTIL